MAIAREGWVYIGALLGLGAIALVLRLDALGALLVLLGLFTTFFFRDPARAIPQGQGLVVSPADGRVVQVVPAPPDHPLGDGVTQVSIFLSVFDVHINRAPIAGRIAAFEHHPGEFLPAFDHKASLRNEQTSITIEDGMGRVLFKQIAGLIARRIVFRKHLNDTVSAGERVGLIKFGSRVDLFLPRGVSVQVKVGDRVQGGASVVARRVSA
jgi:phosphatidylserine decarboxylase